MFTSTKYANKDQSAREYVCISADTKPTTGIVNGSTCIEMDTKKVYIFDEANAQWREL